MARRGLGFLALLLALLPGLGRAGGSLEARVSGGSGVSSVGGTASLDLGTRWTLDVSDDYIDVSSTGAPSRAATLATIVINASLASLRGLPWPTIRIPVVLVGVIVFSCKAEPTAPPPAGRTQNVRERNWPARRL